MHRPISMKGMIVAALFCTVISPAVSAQDAPPNILFILADDLGWRDLSNEGSTFYESPHIDSIAAGGMKFTRGYATCQVCSPSRASLLTGQYPARHGITDWIGAKTGTDWRKAGRHDSHLPPAYAHSLDGDSVTLAEALKAAGYRTFFAGKWHLGSKGSWPRDHGFEFNKGGWDVGGPHGGYFSPYTNPNLESGPPGESLPLRLGEETAAFIEDHKDEPFLAYLSFYSVHGPIQTTQALWSKYRDKAESAGLAPSRFRFDRRLAVRQVQDCPIYAGMIESMDAAVGLVLAKLDELELRDNTIICFTSDNGGVASGDAFATANLPLRGGKGRQWEGGIREPFYICAPGRTRAGSTCSTPVSGIDFFPTLLDLAGVPLPSAQPIDGTSLAPLLKGDPLHSRSLFWHYPHYGNQGGEPSSMVITGDWKLIHYHEDGRDELYNLSDDPGELLDRSAVAIERTRSMRANLDAHLKATGAQFPTPDPQFDPAARKARWERLRTKGVQSLEATHRRYVSPDYSPNKTWWGSTSQDPPSPPPGSPESQPHAPHPGPIPSDPVPHNLVGQ